MQAYRAPRPGGGDPVLDLIGFARPERTRHCPCAAALGARQIWSIVAFDGNPTPAAPRFTRQPDANPQRAGPGALPAKPDHVEALRRPDHARPKCNASFIP